MVRVGFGGLQCFEGKEEEEMRILGFSKKWDKLTQSRFTTFRLPRKDKDWHIGERVQVVYHPRSKDHKLLFIAEIINVESRSFDPAMAPAITNTEAISDGFGGVVSMWAWMDKTHGNFCSSSIFNKITLRKLNAPPTA